MSWRTARSTATTRTRRFRRSLEKNSIAIQSTESERSATCSRLVCVCSGLTRRYRSEFTASNQFEDEQLFYLVNTDANGVNAL